MDQIKVVALEQDRPIPDNWKTGDEFKIELASAICPDFGEVFMVEGSNGTISAIVSHWERIGGLCRIKGHAIGEASR